MAPRSSRPQDARPWLGTARPKTSRPDGVIVAKGTTANQLRGLFLFAASLQNFDPCRRRRAAHGRIADHLLGEMENRR